MTYEKDTQDSETVVPMIMVYQRRIHIRTAKGKDSWGEVQEKLEAN